MRPARLSLLLTLCHRSLTLDAQLHIRNFQVRDLAYHAVFTALTTVPQHFLLETVDASGNFPAYSPPQMDLYVAVLDEKSNQYRDKVLPACSLRIC